LLIRSSTNSNGTKPKNTNGVNPLTGHEHAIKNPLIKE